ncbi:hypothetical protein, variant [Saprolegnia diclina VS20]|uniref:Uncharacterized protein n=1 Tax=Saprolegnia diclina (strain VS20) TaxID=1156394 RepID=T0Q428_SAPDV|nr:hypothetical protein, variant [Saprolegnia diclina VS20]EQC28185.1 hypothetical protein, variant [Saprolegnia diclina VS20]|eukprot:XP_008618333.1 hypothetical protein, variant [Saprolegnia diclina VS20]
MRTRVNSTATADDPIAALEARFEAQARANAAELQGLRAALRPVAPPGEASRAKTALERENAELKAELAALKRKHHELQTMFQEHLRGVQLAATTMTTKVHRLCGLNGDDEAAAPTVQAIAPPAVSKRPIATRSSNGSTTEQATAKRPRRQRKSAVEDPGDPPSVSPPATTMSDVARLRAGMDLTPQLADRFLKQLRGRTQNGICGTTKRACRMLPASVLSSLMGSGDPPPSPASYQYLLEAEIVVLPLFYENHWSVVIVFGLHKAADQPAVIVFFDTFDSRLDEAGVRTHVADFLIAVHRSTRSGAKTTLELHNDHVKVPCQDNPNDSGLWMLRNVERALRACTDTRKVCPPSSFLTNFWNVALEHRIRFDVDGAQDTVKDTRRAMLAIL